METSTHNPALRILLVEDDERIREEIRRALEDYGYEVATARRLSDARAELLSGFSLVLLDLGLPDGEGLDLCREMRAAGDDTPVIILTARDAKTQRIRGLDAGADNYVSKPFDMDLLRARIRSVLRRSQGDVVQGVVRCGELWADTRSRTAGRGSMELELTPIEFDFLLFMLRNPGCAWSRDQIIERVWGLRGGAGGTRAVDHHVKRLRSKIETHPSDPTYLTTVWGLGYRMDDPERSS